VPCSGPEPIGHTTVHYVNNPDFVNNPELARAPELPLTKDLKEDLGASNSNNDPLPFLGDPKANFFGDTTPPSISLIGAAALKQLINMGEEVYIINIHQPEIT